MGAFISILLYQPPSPASYTINANSSPQIFNTIPLYPSVDYYKSARKKSFSCAGGSHHRKRASLGENASSNAVLGDEKRNDTSSQVNITQKDKELLKLKIPCCYFKRKRENDSKRLVVLHSHGNATDLGQMLPFLKMLRDTLNVDVCSYDYVGYGPNLHVKSTEQRVYDSAAAMLRYLQEEHRFETRDIILFGTSLGSGPSVDLASKYQFRGLILQSPFTSIIRTKISRLNLRFMDMFVNIEKINNVRCPVLMIHGEKDDLVPADHSKQLWSLLHRDYQVLEPVFVPLAGHNNIVEKYTLAKYVYKLREFLECITREDSEVNGSDSQKQRRGTLPKLQEVTV
eukprot:CAMPEP_0117438884 /NCGR_PEP_ID=MMETSP0759-20121206/2284_1 /TAXON_ID=63605 /ORGANISM="Percolomonas cosmopolitus, Strain WS" /LENGTH=341 /DNA_ID=CAMNT_0005230591 /DNA_START=179 /DNA_END=1204 /DNA_ORIENTATION=+